MDALEKKYIMGMICFVCIISVGKAKTWEKYSYLFSMTKIIFIRYKPGIVPHWNYICFRLTWLIYVCFGNNNNGCSICTPLLFKNFGSLKSLIRSLGFPLICIDLTMQTRECLVILNCVFWDLSMYFLPEKTFLGTFSFYSPNLPGLAISSQSHSLFSLIMNFTYINTQIKSA